MAKSRNKNNGAPQTVGETTAATLDREVVAQRAYELYLERGGEDGRDLEDWLTAERELRESATLSDK
jgi:outer membrane protein TolC